MNAISTSQSKPDPVGDAVNTVAVGTLIIRPPTDYEWIIHNIYHVSDATLDLITPSGTISAIDTDIGAGLWARYAFHVTNTYYLQVRSSSTIVADGVVSKTP